MTHDAFNICPHCGQPIPRQELNRPAATAPPEDRKAPEREYDHRGIPMPRRTRMGGIITPQ